MEFLGPLYQTINSLLADAIGPILVSLMDQLRTPVYLALSAHIIFVGLGIASGTGKKSFGAQMWDLLKVCIVWNICLSAGNYQLYIIETIEKFQSILATGMTGSADGDQANVFATLDVLITDGMKLSLGSFQNMGRIGFDIGPIVLWLLTGLVIFFCTLAVAGMAGFVILGTVLIIGLLTGIGPLFMASLLFPITQKYALSWINTMFTQVITMTMATLLASFSVAIFSQILTRADITSGAAAPLSVSAITVLSAGAVVYVYKQIGSVSANLSGGISTGLMDMKAAFKGPTAVAAPMVAKSTREDMASGRMETASRWQHIARGNARTNMDYNRRTATRFMEHYPSRSKGAIKAT